jgi:hypothetical protein
LKKELFEIQELLDSGKLSLKEETASKTELESVKKENEKLKMQIDILKRVNICYYEFLNELPIYLIEF